MNVLDLFSGIGGFSLGLERAGMRTVAFCEVDARCRAALARHWPDIPCYHDVTKLDGRQLSDIDVIAGGFPCQDISSAADAPAGIEGLRSGLWREFARLIGELRPKFAIVENVSALRQRGLDVVLGDLAALGYDAEWHCIPASAVGAPHPRDRIWIVAYTPEMLWQGQRRNQPRRILSRDGLLSLLDNEGRGEPVPSWWAAEPSVDRVVHGVSHRVDRLGQLSNAVVPQIPELIGRAIMGIRISCDNPVVDKLARLAGGNVDDLQSAIREAASGSDSAQLLDVVRILQERRTPSPLPHDQEAP